MILLFTSARSDRPLYRRDLLNVCCEPIGTRIQFGYDIDWIAENLQSTDALHRIVGEDALIIYCEKNTDQSFPVFTYHPVRLAKVVKTLPEFGSVTLEIELKGFFDYQRFRGSNPDIIQRFQEFVLRREEQPTPSNRNLQARFVREDEAWEPNAYKGDWLPLVGHLSPLEGLKEAIFFSVQAPHSFGGAPSFILPAHSLDGEKTTYDFTSGQSYDIKLYVLHGREAKYQIPTVTLEEPIASISGPFVRQRSSGLQADYLLHCKRSFDEERTLLTIGVPTDDFSQVQAPQFNSLIRFRGVSKKVLITAVLFLTSGPFLMSFGPELIRDTALNFGARPGNELVQHPLAISWVLKFIGGAFFAFGAYLGVRKMPIKF